MHSWQNRMNSGYNLSPGICLKSLEATLKLSLKPGSEENTLLLYLVCSQNES